MNTDSQRIRIQRWLSTGAHLTPLMALEKFGCLSLSQRIGELRRQRWPIVSRLVRVGNKRIAMYSIDTSKKRKS